MLTGAWLLALLMTGMPLLALWGNNGGDVDDDPDDRAHSVPDETPQEMITDEGACRAEEDVKEGGSPPPTDYEFILQEGGDHRIEGFRTGTDTLTLTSEDWDFDLYDLGPGDEGAALQIDRGEKAAVLRFPGLNDLPKEDIYLMVAEPGEELQRVALLDALYPDDAEVTPLFPTDPDATDALPDDPSSDAPLAPADPEEQEVPPDPIETAVVLFPTAPDAPEDAGRRP